MTLEDMMESYVNQGGHVIVYYNEVFKRPFIGVKHGLYEDWQYFFNKSDSQEQKTIKELIVEAFTAYPPPEEADQFVEDFRKNQLKAAAVAEWQQKLKCFLESEAGK